MFFVWCVLSLLSMKGVTITVQPCTTEPQAHFQTFDSWFEKYRAGKIAYLTTPNLSQETLKTHNILQVDDLGPTGVLQKGLNELANAGNKDAAERLILLASFRFHPDPRQEKERYFLQQPWMIRAMAIETLGKIKNPETLHWLSTDVLLAKNRRSFTERAIAAKALGITGYQPSLLGVLSALYDESWEVRAAAADAAGKFGGAKVAKAIVTRIDDDEPSVRTRCLEALSVSFDSRDPQLVEADKNRIFSAAIARLKDPDWRVRVVASDFFVAHPNPQAIPSLITALQTEKDGLRNGKGRKRVFFNLIEALTQVAGSNISPTDPAAWQAWWEEKKDNFQPVARTERKKGEIKGIPYYFGIPVRSDRLVFLLDVSGSMEDLCDPTFLSGMNVPYLSSSKKISKLEWAKQELISTLQKMEPNDRFNVIFFETSVFPVFDGTVSATTENVSIAINRIRNVSSGGGTNLFGALELGLRIQSLNSLQPFETDADTVFLLSDGSPSTGLVTDRQAIQNAIEIANRGSRIAVHTICFGGSDKNALTLMQALAAQNYGEFRQALDK